MDENPTAELNNLSPDAVFIPVIGLTGSGKSNFISLCTGEKCQDSDEASILDVKGFKLYSFQHYGRTVHLIETPGFDRPGREDEDFLQECAYWLLKSFSAGVRIAGLVYTFNIDCPRLSGSARRGLQVFKAMCGKQNASATVIATTMWDRVDQEVGKERVKSLVEEEDFWGDFYQEGSHVEPIYGDRKSCLRIINLLLSHKPDKVLQIQQQMILEKKLLHQTDAGKLLFQSNMNKKRDLERQVEEAREYLHQQLDQSHQRQMVKVDEITSWMSGKIEGRVSAITSLQKASADLVEMWDIRVRDEMRRIKMELSRNQDLLQDLEKSFEKKISDGTYGDAGCRKRLEKELGELRKKVQVLQKTEDHHLEGFQMALTGGNVVGAGLGLAAAIVPLVACCVM